MPAPKCVTSLPDASNLRIGSSCDPSQANGTPGFICDGAANTPQRSATHTLRPSRSMSTPLVEPHTRPSGIFAQFSIERYGLGSALVGAEVCAHAKPMIASAAMAPSANVERWM
jgi:hypothetical protein